MEQRWVSPTSLNSQLLRSIAWVKDKYVTVEDRTLEGR
jgi:hypothetical protein